MKKIIFLLIALLCFSYSHSQNWIQSEGTTQNEEILDLTHDNNGNVLLGGYYSSNFILGSQNLTAGGVSQGLLFKTQPTGAIIWAKSIGKSGADRIYSVAVDQEGNVFSTGYISGNFEQEGIQVSTNNNSRDIFISKHDSDGNLEWIKTAGGPNGDTGYGVAVDSEGNIFLTGQFKGSSEFGGDLLQGSFDDVNNLETFDFFISKIDTDGNFLWTKQGNAKYNDRGMSVAVDNNDHVYIAGQFSDTLEFDNIHQNSVMNAGFLLKIDNNGNEMWFSKLAGVQSILYDVKIDANNNPIVTGDFIGTMLVHGVGNQLISTSNYTYNAMTAKYNANGEILWLADEGSESEVSSKQLTIDQHGNIFTIGVFKCRFDEFSEEHGTGIFYSMGYRDIYSVGYNNNGTRLWKEHYGGTKDDYASAINFATNSTSPTIAGSFEMQFNFSKGNAAYINSDFNGSQWSSYYCGSNTYQSVGYLENEGAKDLFYGQIRHSSNSELDYFMRTANTSCVQDSIQPCVSNCLDTIEFCDEGYISISSFTHSTGTFGPILISNWQNEGFTEDNSYYVNQSGSYTAQISREDGCWTNHPDTVEVIIHSSPEPPRMTDSKGVNINQLPTTTSLEWCHPDTAIIHVDNFSIADTAYWNNSLSLTFLNDSTIQVTETGYYQIMFENGIGCSSTNAIPVEVDTFAIHDTLQPFILFHDSILEATDTIEICLGEVVYLSLLDSLFMNITGGEIPYKTVYWSVTSPATLLETETITHHFNGILTDSTGNYTVNAHLENLCGDTVDYFISRDLHIIVHEPPTLTGNLLGPSDVCPGDTIMLYGNSSSGTFSISGPNIIANYEDSVLIVAPYSNAYYTIQGSVTDSVTGCTRGFFDNWQLTIKPTPQITISPSNGIICPGDSVELTSLSGVAWEWIGPDDNGFASSQITFGHTPGYYHAIVTDPNGCVMTSNFVEAKEYSTPELIALPEFICENGSTDISVIGSNFTDVTWYAPLSGNSFTQSVQAPGTYVCEMELCGITTIDSVMISLSIPEAVISTQDSLNFCPGDTVTIIANGGMISYNWNDGNQQDYVLATVAGDYWVVVTNEYGCTDTSNIISINQLPQPEAPITSDTMVCLGGSLNLNASATESIFWYDNPSGNQIGTGPSYMMNNIITDTSIYLRTQDSICASNWSEISIGIYESSIAPTITGDSILCENTNLFLSTSYNPNLNYQWLLPDQSTNDSCVIDIQNVNTNHSGIYQLTVNDSICASDTTVIHVQIVEYPIGQLNLSYDTTLCYNETITLGVENTEDSIEIIWMPNQVNSLNYEVTSSGIYFAAISNEYCTTITDSVSITIHNEIENSYVNDTLICPSNDVQLYTIDSSDVIWYNSSLDSIGFSSTIFIEDLTENTSFSYATTDSTGCQSELQIANVYIAPTDSAPPIYIDGTGCDGTSVSLSTINYDNLNHYWILPNDSTSHEEIVFIPNMSDTLSGNYQLVIEINGCFSDTQTTYLGYHIADTIDLPEDTTLCESDILNLEFNDSLSFNWSSGSTLNNFSTSSEGLVTAVITNQFGCSYTDSIYVYLIDCDSLNSPNVFTPNNDGVNDVFYFGILETRHQKVVVRNRYGNIVHIQENDSQVNWDGNDYLTNLPVSSGVYFYNFTYTDWNGKTHEKNGFVTIKR